MVYPMGFQRRPGAQQPGMEAKGWPGRTPELLVALHGAKAGRLLQPWGAGQKLGLCVACNAVHMT